MSKPLPVRIAVVTPTRYILRTVGLKPTRIDPGDEMVRGVVGAPDVPIYLGGEGVTSETGYVVDPQNTVTYPLGMDGPLYAVRKRRPRR